MIFPTGVQLKLKYHTQLLSEYKKKTTFFFFIMFYLRHCHSYGDIVVAVPLLSRRNFYFIAILLLGLWGWSISAFVHHSWSHSVTCLACTSTTSIGSSECWVHTGHTCRIGKQGQWSGDTLLQTLLTLFNKHICQLSLYQKGLSSNFSMIQF